MELLKLPDLNDFVVTVVLEGTSYRLHFAWNDRAGFWALGVRDGNNVAVIEGIKCVPNWPLLRQYHRPALPPGEFICVVTNKAQTIGRLDFVEGNAKLVYLTAAEVKQYGSV